MASGGDPVFLFAPSPRDEARELGRTLEFRDQRKPCQGAPGGTRRVGIHENTLPCGVRWRTIGKTPCRQAVVEKGAIFGYNTEVRNGDTIYHIQSEARGGAHLLETLVFVAGHCVAKRSTPAEDSADAQAMQERLRKQHRFVLDCVRQGLLELPASPEA